MAKSNIEPHPATPLEVYRRSVGLSRKAAAELAGVSTETIARLERRETSPQPATKVVLATALGVAGEILFPAEVGADDRA